MWATRDFPLKGYETWLPELLADLAAEGETFGIVAELEALERHPSPTVARAVQKGIASLASRQVADGESGQVQFVLWQASGPSGVTWPPFMDWLTETLLADSRNMRGIRKKLANAGGDERHAFIGVTYASPWAAFHALTRDANTLPSQPPELPEEITHLWLLPAQSGERCLVWYPEEGWFDPSRRWATP